MRKYIYFLVFALVTVSAQAIEPTCATKEQILEKLKKGIPYEEVFKWVVSQCFHRPIPTQTANGVSLVGIEYVHLSNCQISHEGFVRPHVYGPRNIDLQIHDGVLQIRAEVSYYDCAGNTGELTKPYSPLVLSSQDYFKFQTERTEGQPWTTLSAAVEYQPLAEDRSLAVFDIPLVRFFSDENYNAYQNYATITQKIYLKAGFTRKGNQFDASGYPVLTFTFTKQKDGSTVIQFLSFENAKK